MLFNTFSFLWIFPLIFCAYWFIATRKALAKAVPQIGNFILLASSYILYIKAEPAYALILLWVTLVTFLAALKIEKDHAFGKRRYIVWTGIVLAILPLLVFKYFNFVSSQLEILLSTIGVSKGLPGLNWAIPLGLSFYTFQATGYLADVYLQRYKAEHNWWSYMLFVAFFPQVASGPISKAKDLLPQINNRQRTFVYDQFVNGCKWMLWGMFMKVCVADRIGTIVNPVFTNYMFNDGGTLALSTVLYSFQIYSDFAGYSFMALGGVSYWVST